MSAAETTGTSTTRRNNQDRCLFLSDSPSPEARSVYKNPPQLSSVYLQEPSSNPYTSQITFPCISPHQSKANGIIDCNFTIGTMKSRFTVSKDKSDHGLKL